MTDAKRKRFALGMAVYALIFLLLTAGGLWVFWQFLEAYELSRPRTAVNDYLEELTEDRIHTGAESLLASLDGNLQTEDQAFRVILDALSEPITAVKSGKSTSDRAVYVLRSGSQTIGSAAFVPGEADDFGFTPWVFAEETFDFSWLLGPEISVTVPAEFPVSFNGNLLEDTYITQRDIPYPVLSDFAGEFAMPTMVTYTASRYLGKLEFAVTNTDGVPIYLQPDTDMDQFVPRPSEENTARVDTLARDFLRRYIVFCSNANAEQDENFGWLNQLLVPGSGLSRRLSTAVDGLQYAQSISDRIEYLNIHGIYQMEEGRYLCDMSYGLLSYGQKGPVQTDHNMKLVLLQTAWGLRVEAMTRY